jgi:uncharacterized repeat protein (TIGR03803 family)
MRFKKQWLPSITFLLLTVPMTVTYATAQSTPPQEKILVGFRTAGQDGNLPSGGVIRDAAGNFYGVTQGGGPGGNRGNGAVYEVSPAANGGWTAKSLYVFHAGTQDGQDPLGGLVMDSAGNLFGTTSLGGTNLCSDGFDNPTGCGTAFELSPSGSGGWTEKIIYNFGQDAWSPGASMIIDAAGNLYGTTGRSGDLDSVGGTVFELQHNGDQWTRTTLHTFGQDEGDGAGPTGPLVFDKAGNLYGATVVGGNAGGGGVVFRLSNTGSGWAEDILFNFVPTSTLPSGGSQPNGGLIFDSAGNLYGTTNAGGIRLAQGCGVVFQLTPTSSGTWNENVLHQILCNQNGVANPLAGMVIDSAGRLFGTTGFGGSSITGTVFELKPLANGAWAYSVMYTFQGSPKDGQEPNASLLLDSKGNLYGTTEFGGPSGFGTLFEIRP